MKTQEMANIQQTTNNNNKIQQKKDRPNSVDSLPCPMSPSSPSKILRSTVVQHLTALYPRPNPAHKTPDNWRYRDAATFMRQASSLAAAHGPRLQLQGVGRPPWVALDGSPPTSPISNSSAIPPITQISQSRPRSAVVSHPPLEGPEGAEEGRGGSSSNPGVIAPRETWSCHGL